VLLDTTFVIDLQREFAGGRSRGAKRFLEQHGEERPRISLITWMEFAEGYKEDGEDACRLFLSRFPLIPLDIAIAWRASRIARTLRGGGARIGDHDIWIAATALVHEIPLVTRNPRHFTRIPQLTVLAY
jgi:tRNA(fMet)-specific endonuclease VapC